MRIRWTNKTLAGTTLVEVIVAVAILAVMAGAIISSLGYGFLTTQLVRENQRATQIILEKAEIIRLYSWDQVNSNGFIPDRFTNVYDPQALPNAQGVTYYGTLSISNFPSGCSYSTNMRQLTVTLNWTNAGRIPRARSFTTHIARDGLQSYVY